MKIELHPDAQSNFNEKAEKLFLNLAKYQEPPHPVRPKSAGPDIHIAAEFTEENIIGEIEIGMCDESGNESGKLFTYEESRVGLFGEEYKNLVRLGENIQKAKSLRETVSVGTLIDLIFLWMKDRYINKTSIPMSEFVLSECEKRILKLEIWIPIAWLHVQSEIQLGKITFRSITREMLDLWFANKPPATTPEEEFAFNHFMSRERGDLQGFAAATIQLEAEPNRATEIAFDEAERSVSLLRFFSPANFSPRRVSYCTLMGREHLETSRHLIVQDGRIINYSRGVVDKTEPRWAISTSHLAELKSVGLDILNNWLLSDRRSDFAELLLDCLSLYSKNCLAKDPTDKLIYLLVSLESVLLKDNNEVIQNNLAERLAFGIGADAKERKEIITNTKKIYDLRSSFIHHGNYIDIDDLSAVEEFMMTAWRFLQWLIQVIDKGLTRNAFFDLLETRKLS